MQVTVSNNLYDILLKTDLGLRVVSGIDSDTHNYLDIAHVDNRKISYIPKNRLDDFNGNVFDIALRRKYAMAGRAGKVMGKLLDAEPDEITKFVSQYYAELERAGITKAGKLIETDDFSYYLEKHHFSESGTLGSSCMKYDECQDGGYFDIYEHFGTRLLLYKKDGLVTARALIWTGVKFNGVKGLHTFMDRVYTNNTNDEQILFNYAREKGWYYKVHQSYDHKVEFMCPLADGEYESRDLTAAVHGSGTIDFCNYPYIDTFSFGDDYCLRNTTNREEDYSYESTDGIRLHPEMEYSEYHDCDILSIEATYSEYLNTVIYENESVNCRGIDSYMPENHSDIVQIGNGDYWHTDHVKYIERIDEYIETEYSIYSEWSDSDEDSRECLEIDGEYVHQDDYDDYMKENKEEDEEDEVIK